jgi:cysteine desulfurase/selenocysteine lyase
MAEKINYLNTAGVGLIPRSVVEKIQRFYARGLSTPPYDELFDENSELVERTRGQFASLINASTPEVSFQTNASTSLSTVVQMIEFRRGDNVIVDDLGFPSDVYPVLGLRSRGVEVRMVKNKRGYVSHEEYERVVDRRTRLIMVSFVSWINGMRADVEAIGRIAEERGSYFMVDATHGAGYLKIDTKKWKVHFLATSNYKWLLSPFGASEFYIAKSVLDEFDPPHVGWHSVVERGESQPFGLHAYELPHSARKFEPGNPDYASIYGLGQSLQFLARTGYSRIERDTLKLSGRIIDGLDKLGIDVLTPVQQEKRSALLFTHLRGMHGEELAARLKKRKIWVSARYFGKLSGLRIAPYFYNSEEDVEELLEALGSIVNGR